MRGAQFRTTVTIALPVIQYIRPVSPYLHARGSQKLPTDMPANAAAVQKIITCLHAGLKIAAT